jgi:muramoyltetrapeptide carboxypeptidase LdcA involved in peptidoglycan recycling
MGDDMCLPYTVNEFRNNLVNLALAGILEDTSGLVIGRGYKYNANMQELAKVTSEGFEVIAFRNNPPDNELPIPMNVDFGHTSSFLTLPIGALVSLDFDSNGFIMHEPGVQA